MGVIVATNAPSRWAPSASSPIRPGPPPTQPGIDMPLPPPRRACERSSSVWTDCGGSSAVGDRARRSPAGCPSTRSPWATGAVGAGVGVDVGVSRGVSAGVGVDEGVTVTAAVGVAVAVTVAAGVLIGVAVGVAFAPLLLRSPLPLLFAGPLERSVFLPSPPPDGPPPPAPRPPFPPPPVVAGPGDAVGLAVGVPVGIVPTCRSTELPPDEPSAPITVTVTCAGPGTVKVCTIEVPPETGGVPSPKSQR